MTTMHGLILILGSVLLFGGIGWYWWNWYADWTTRLKKRLPQPPIGYLWQLQRIPTDNGTVYCHLRLYDLATEKTTSCHSVYLTPHSMAPSRQEMDAWIWHANRRVYELEPFQHPAEFF